MKNKKIIYIVLPLLLIIYYFMIPVSIFWDSGHYMSYVSILEGNMPWSSWDIVRGIIFPLMIRMSNLLFGKTSQGLLILTFLFYLGMLITVKYILDNSLQIKNTKIKKCIYISVFAYLILDPIIYGYYHALLTEFIAMTISLVMCFFSWKWLDIDFFKAKKKYIVYSISFALLTVYSWHLKQPYVSITIFPVITAAIISIFKNRKLKNIIQRLSTVALCIIMLIISMQLWNCFLASNGVELNTDRNVTSSFGNMLLMDGLNNYSTTDDFENIKFLSKSEKNILKDNKNYLLIDIHTPNGKLIDQDIVKLNSDGNVSTATAIKYIFTQMFKHPLLVLESYTSNYLAIANIYPKASDDGGVSYYVNKNIDLSYCHENCTIATRITSSSSNIMYMYDDAYQRVANYEQFNSSPRYVRVILLYISKITLNVYKIVLLLLPIFCILTIVSISKKKNQEHFKLLAMVLILSWYSLLHILVHVATGANIDRYASPAYISTILAIIIYMYYIISIKKKFWIRGSKNGNRAKKR